MFYLYMSCPKLLCSSLGATSGTGELCQFSLEPSLSQLFQPVFIRDVLQFSAPLCGPDLDLLLQVQVFPVLDVPDADAELQVGSHQS